jgi:hypothetical protein
MRAIERLLRPQIRPKQFHVMTPSEGKCWQWSFGVQGGHVLLSVEGMSRKGSGFTNSVTRPTFFRPSISDTYSPGPSRRFELLLERLDSFRLADLPGVIQKLIIPADQGRPNPLQMTGFEFGPSVAIASQQ